MWFSAFAIARECGVDRNFPNKFFYTRGGVTLISDISLRKECDCEEHSPFYKGIDDQRIWGDKMKSEKASIVEVKGDGAVRK